MNNYYPTTSIHVDYNCDHFIQCDPFDQTTIDNFLTIIQSVDFTNYNLDIDSQFQACLQNLTDCITYHYSYVFVRLHTIEYTNRIVPHYVCIIDYINNGTLCAPFKFNYDDHNYRPYITLNDIKW